MPVFGNAPSVLRYCLPNPSHWALLPRLLATPCLGVPLSTLGYCLPKHYHKHCLFVPPTSSIFAVCLLLATQKCLRLGMPPPTYRYCLPELTAPSHCGSRIAFRCGFRSPRVLCPRFCSLASLASTQQLQISCR